VTRHLPPLRSTLQDCPYASPLLAKVCLRKNETAALG
jgi:hypothetical protein